MCLDGWYNVLRKISSLKGFLCNRLFNLYIFKAVQARDEAFWANVLINYNFSTLIF